MKIFNGRKEKYVFTVGYPDITFHTTQVLTPNQAFEGQIFT